MAKRQKSPYFLQTIEAIAKHYEFDRNTAWKDLPKHVQQVFLYGSGDEEIAFRYDEGGRVYQVTRACLKGSFPIWNGAIARPIQTGFARNSSDIKTIGLAAPAAGSGCATRRWRSRWADLHVGQVVQMSIREALAWIEEVRQTI